LTVLLLMIMHTLAGIIISWSKFGPCYIHMIQLIHEAHMTPVNK